MYVKALKLWANRGDKPKWKFASVVSSHTETRKKVRTGGGTEVEKGGGREGNGS